MARAPLAEAVFFEFAVEGSFADAEDFGGGLAVACGEVECVSDGAFFELFEAGSGEGAVGVRDGVGVVCGVVAGAEIVGDVSDVEGEVVGIGALADGGDDEVLDDVEELADVAGPVVTGQSHHGGVGDGRYGRAGEDLVDCVGQSVCDDAWDVFAALAEWWEVDFCAADAEVEILAEAALLDEVGEVFVGCADDADVGLACVVAADADDFSGFEYAEEFGLHFQGHVADFVEEEGSAGGVLEDALAFSFGAGEGPADVAEELVFEEGLGLGGAVDGHEAFGGAW